MKSETSLVGHLARLARIGLTPEEEKRYGKEFQAIVDFVGQVERVHVDGSPMKETITGVRHVVREDIVEPSNFADVLLAQAPSVERGAIKVPAVI